MYAILRIGTVRLFLARLLRTVKEERLLAWSFFVGAASLVLMPFFQSVYVLIALSFMLGLGMGCGQPIITMLMYSYSPKAARAKRRACA